MIKHDAHVREFQRFLCQKSVQTFSFHNCLEILFFIIFIILVSYLIGYSHALYDFLTLLDYFHKNF